jgi:DNA-binding transcriptional MerR regulator
VKTVKEVSRLTGLSVRALHYYDEIGLCKPGKISASGYRLYDDRDLERLQQILLYRELDFPLKEITAVLNAPSYDKTAALRSHKEILILKRDRLSRLAALVNSILEGENVMSFQEFDRSEIETAQEKYAQEAKEKWGDTPAYRESVKKTSAYGEEEWRTLSEESDAIFRAFSEKRGLDPGDPALQTLVARWQGYITKNFYFCSREILHGLGEMYTSDARFTDSIDRYGKGTARLMNEAIRFFCRSSG